VAAPASSIFASSGTGSCRSAWRSGVGAPAAHVVELLMNAIIRAGVVSVMNA
jgi:hypothetical protein